MYLSLPAPRHARTSLSTEKGLIEHAPTLAALTGFVAWSLALLLLMEAMRSWLVVTGAVSANGFCPDNSNLSPFMQRLARAHANCLEGLPIFGGLMLVAVAAGQSALTDPLAYVLLLALAAPRP